MIGVVKQLVGNVALIFEWRSRAVIDADEIKQLVRDVALTFQWRSRAVIDAGKLVEPARHV